MSHCHRYSFDVFDTLLTRTLLSPLDVFRCVQHRLLNDRSSHAYIPDDVIGAFVPARIWMEFKARRQTSREDVSLAEIYDLFVREFALNPAAADALLDAELAVERLCSVPVGHNREKVNRLREVSPTMIYVSDMYLPPAFIKELLERHGLWRVGDSLYVSGSIGFTKGHGSLYRHILDREGLSAADLIHCGDNLHSDVVVPRRLGIGIDADLDISGNRTSDFGPGFLAKVRYATLLLKARSTLGWSRVA